MEDVDVVDCQVEQQGLQVHRVDRPPHILKHDLREFVDERADGSVGLGLEVEERVFLDEEVEEALPVLENGDPLVVLQ